MAPGREDTRALNPTGGRECFHGTQRTTTSTYSRTLTSLYFLLLLLVSFLFYYPDHVVSVCIFHITFFSLVQQYATNLVSDGC